MALLRAEAPRGTGLSLPYPTQDTVINLRYPFEDTVTLTAVVRP